MAAVEATLRIAPRPALDHSREECGCEGHHRLDQHLDLLQLASGVRFSERASRREAGVVDEDLDVEAELCDPAGDPRAGGRL